MKLHSLKNWDLENQSQCLHTQMQYESIWFQQQLNERPALVTQFVQERAIHFQVFLIYLNVKVAIVLDLLTKKVFK